MAVVSNLFVSPGRGSRAATPLDEVDAVAAHGFEGCAHANPPKREVLLVSKEHLDALDLEPGQIRENITIEGEDVQRWSVGRRVRVGEALLEVTMACDPCHKMDWIRPGLRAELDGRRGMLAHVVEGGRIRVGDEVAPV